MQLTERINRIQISPTSAVIAEAEKLKSRGVDIADFGPGEPDFPTPDHIKKAAIRAIEQNFTKYTPTGGILPLREAICEWHKRELGSHYDPKECVVNVGGKHSIFNVVSVLVQQGDEVIIPAPYWVSYPDIVKYAGGTPVFVESRAEDEFSVTAAVIAKAITPKTRMVILSSPNNPTGGVIPPDEYERILAVCKKHNVWLMGDECYSHFTYDPHKPYSIASHADSKAHVIIIGSMSKTFAMTGWRIGYACGPAALIEAMMKVHQYSMLCASIISQEAAIEALLRGEDSMKKMRDQYHRRRDFIVRRFNEIGLKCHLPRGSFYAFPDISVTGLSEKDFAVGLLQAEKVAMVPGTAFGANGSGFCRACFATSYEQLIEAGNRIERHVQSLAKKP